MIRKSAAILALGAIALASCNKTEGKVDTAAVEKQIKDEEAQWARHYADHNADGLASHYADDAALANPDTPIAVGKDAIRKETASFAADPNLNVQFASDRVQVAASEGSEDAREEVAFLEEISRSGARLIMNQAVAPGTHLVFEVPGAAPAPSYR